MALGRNRHQGKMDLNELNDACDMDIRTDHQIVITGVSCLRLPLWQNSAIGRLLVDANFSLGHVRLGALPGASVRGVGVVPVPIYASAPIPAPGTNC